MVRVVFVTGFNRSGTTLVTSAVTDATGGTTLTAGHLARHIPTLDRFLATAKKKGITPDRGVDRLQLRDRPGGPPAVDPRQQPADAPRLPRAAVRGGARPARGPA